MCHVFTFEHFKSLLTIISWPFNPTAAVQFLGLKLSDRLQFTLKLIATSLLL